MAMSRLGDLQGLLSHGLAAVQELWSYEARNWVTGVYAADIDNDGDCDVVAVSRDGRVYALTNNGKKKWTRIVHNKCWVGAVTCTDPCEEQESPTRIIIGTRDGKVYALDREGRTLHPNGRALRYDESGNTLESEAEHEAGWCDTQHAIRQIYVNPKHCKQIIIGSEDHHVYMFDYATGTLCWRRDTGSWVRSVFAYDIDQDGVDEILAGSLDKKLSIFNQQGTLIKTYHFSHSVHTIFAADINSDNFTEILVGTDNRELIAFKPDLSNKTEESTIVSDGPNVLWHYQLDNRPLTLCVGDIDGDEHQEILVGSEDKHIYLIDEHGKLIWRYHHRARIFSLHVKDIDKDGTKEILIGSDDNKIHACRFNLSNTSKSCKYLEKAIRQAHSYAKKHYKGDLGLLTPAERELLADILNIRDVSPKNITFKGAKRKLSAKQYLLALQALLQLEQNKVQLRWTKRTSGYIRSLAFGDISGDSRQEIIIVGTSDGLLEAFTYAGNSLWKLSMGGQIITARTGYIDSEHREDIVACSTSKETYIVSGADMTAPEHPTKRSTRVDGLISCVYVMAGQDGKGSKIVIGTEDRNIYFYDRDLSVPSQVIKTEQGIKILQVYDKGQVDVPAIVAGSMTNHVYAYTREGKRLWTHRTYGRVRDVCIYDIDNDGSIEIIVGSEDRNVYVLNANGTLRWRYFFPHKVLTVGHADVNNNGEHEILIGCADTYMYVFSSDGDMLWKYKGHDRIRAMCIGDINDDRMLEVAIGSEDRLELLQIVDQHNLHPLIEQCWLTLQKEQQTPNLIGDLLRHPQPVMRAFALRQMVKHAQLTPSDLHSLKQLVNDEVLLVKTALIYTVMSCYEKLPTDTLLLIETLSLVNNQEVIIAFIKHLPILLRCDTVLGQKYLERFSRNNNRYIRRAVVRILHQLIPHAVEYGFSEISFSERGDTDNPIFSNLLRVALNEESEWTQQEACRTLALYLEGQHDKIIVIIYVLVIKNIRVSLLQDIANNATTQEVKQTAQIFASLLAKDLCLKNVQEHLEKIVRGFEEVKSLEWGPECWIVYKQLQRLFAMRTIDEFACYHTLLLPELQQLTDAPPFREIRSVCERLGLISRCLRIYLRRDNLNERMASLLEAREALQQMRKVINDEVYNLRLFEEALVLPTQRLFHMLLDHWNALIQAAQDTLLGKAELVLELQTQSIHFENPFGISLQVKNSGRSTAHEVQISLCNSDTEMFRVTGKQLFILDEILPCEERSVEFILRIADMQLAQACKNGIELTFDITFDDLVDLDRERKHFKYCERVLFTTDHDGLQARKFDRIDSPYIIGLPARNPNIFFGRERDIVTLQENLTRLHTNSIVVLYGQRRSGKTTLMLHLQQNALRANHLSIFVDMQLFAYQMSVNKFLLHLAQSLLEALKQKGVSAPTRTIHDFVDDPCEAFRTFLSEIEPYLQKRCVIIMLDEFEVLEEQVKKGTLEPDFLQFLRHLMQFHPYLNFLLSGRHTIEELTRDYWSVFFNMAHHYQLSKLDEHGATRLIVEPVELEYDALAVRKIRMLTGDQPYLIHLICDALVQHCNERQKTYVTINDVNIVLREAMSTGHIHFNWIWDQLSRPEQLLLTILADIGREEGRAVSLIEIEEGYRYHHIATKREDLLRTLKLLSKADVIEHVKDTTNEFLEHALVQGRLRYTIPVGLLRRWLLREKPIELLLKDMLRYQIL